MKPRLFSAAIPMLPPSAGLVRLPTGPSTVKVLVISRLLAVESTIAPAANVTVTSPLTKLPLR